MNTILLKAKLFCRAFCRNVSLLFSLFSSDWTLTRLPDKKRLDYGPFCRLFPELLLCVSLFSLMRKRFLMRKRDPIYWDPAYGDPARETRIRVSRVTVPTTERPAHRSSWPAHRSSCTNDLVLETFASLSLVLSGRLICISLTEDDDDWKSCENGNADMKPLCLVPVDASSATDVLSSPLRVAILQSPFGYKLSFVLSLQGV